MRYFIKGRWFPLIIGVLILLLVGVVMALLGFRITYAPELETSWEAVSAVAAWAGAIGTVAAVFSAIHVANQQNKIALFEKRYELYTSISKMIFLADKIWWAGETDISNTLNFFDHFCSSPENFSMKMGGRDREKERQRIIDAVLRDTKKVLMLFNCLSRDDIEAIKNAITALQMLIVQKTPLSELKNSISKDKWEKIQKALERMEQQLYL